MVDQGIRQFLDIGSGIPTAGNVHEIAQERVPGCRVVYVDIDQVAVGESVRILADSPLATAISGDLRTPEQIIAELGSSELRALIDPAQPVGLLLAAVTHFLPEEARPYEAIATLREWLPVGSYMALTQGAVESYTPEQAEKSVRHTRDVGRLFRPHVQTPRHCHSSVTSNWSSRGWSSRTRGGPTRTSRVTSSTTLSSQATTAASP